MITKFVSSSINKYQILNNFKLFSTINKSKLSISNNDLITINVNNKNCHINKYTYLTLLSSTKLKSKSSLFTNKWQYNFCSKSQSYIDHYKSLNNDIHDKKQKIKQLQQKIQMLSQMSQMSTTDQILKLLYSVVGFTYQTKAYKQHKQILIDLRNILQKRIQESSIQWQQPRKLIIQQRQKRISQFVQAIIEYEGKMGIFIKKRQTNKAQHLADVNQGLILTHKLLIKNIQKQGGIQIWVQKGQLFNSQIHQIVNQKGQTILAKGNKQNLKIQNLIQAGWRLKDKLIRKAKVTLVK